jgi:hypothetical protein
VNGPRIIEGRLCSPIRLLPLTVCLLLVLVAACDLFVLPTSAQGSDSARRVNAPCFDGDVRFSEMAVFWFGQVNGTDNYADVRVGYNDEYLRIRIAAFDRYLWYDMTHSSSLTEWDGATLYLDVNGDGGSALDTANYRFVAQINAGEARDDYQMAFRGGANGWVDASIPFTTTAGWRGTDFNRNGDGHDDRGWALDFYIPFASLGLPTPPADGARWGLALAMHDRDNAAGSPPIADKHWPEVAHGTRPITWGQLVFNPAPYQPPPVPAGGTTIIRHRSAGATVMDASVGGYTVCGDGRDFWTEWGYTNEAFYNPGRSDFNIQNQADVADWPCFSKYYVTFPLDALPSGKVILSATLTLHQFGGSNPSRAQPSLIQVLTVGEDWDERTLTWNDAPLAVENVAAGWVDPLITFPGWPGVRREWDVSRAVAEAYAAGGPLRLALYEADSAYDSGKYFVSSDTGDWNAEGRPTLTIVWGQEPRLAKSAQAGPAPDDILLSLGSTITYALQVLGSGQALTVTDVLPARISHPLTYTTGYGSIAYDSAGRKLTWTGSPSMGQAVTITYPVTVTQSGTYAIVNTACLTTADGSASTASSVVIVEPWRLFLPYILKWR